MKRPPKTKPQGPGPGRDFRGQHTRGQNLVQGNDRTCKAKQTYLAQQHRARRRVKAEAQKTDRAEIREKLKAAMALARAKAPLAPNERTKLALLIGEETLAAAEQQILTANPHLCAKRDGPMVTSLAYLNATLKSAWRFFSSGAAKLAYATKSGKVSWNKGLAGLVQLESLRGKVAGELCTTPSSRHGVGLTVEIENTNVFMVDDEDSETYIAKLKALVEYHKQHPDEKAEVRILGTPAEYIKKLRAIRQREEEEAPFHGPREGQA